MNLWRRCLTTKRGIKLRVHISQRFINTFSMAESFPPINYTELKQGVFRPKRPTFRISLSIMGLGIYSSLTKVRYLSKETTAELKCVLLLPSLKTPTWSRRFVISVVLTRKWPSSSGDQTTPNDSTSSLRV